MLAAALEFLLESLGALFVLALLLRFHMQWLRAPFRNPVGQAVMALTDFVVKPLRRVLPAWGGLDWASLAPAWLLQWLLLLALLWLRGFPLLVAGAAILPGVALWALVRLLALSLYLLMGVIFVQAILSWVNPYSPLASVLNALSAPFLGPLRRFLPPLGGSLDLSPLIALIVLQLCLMLPVAWLEMTVLELFR
jgi:YggT family protein